MGRAWVMGYMKAHEIVTVTTSGVMTLAMMDAMSREALAYGLDHGAKRFLLDHRNMTPEIPILKIYKAPDALARLGVPRHMKIATVYSKDSCRKSDFEFFENVAMNRGLPYRLFADLDIAMEWLKAR
jgi:hypothetical protein